MADYFAIENGLTITLIIIIAEILIFSGALYYIDEGRHRLVRATVPSAASPMTSTDSCAVFDF